MIEDVLNQREKTHGDFANQAVIAQGLKALCPINDPVLREAAHMICHKLARIVAGNEREPDHWLDIAGYATLAHREVGKPEQNPEAAYMARLGGIMEQLIVKGKL